MAQFVMQNVICSLFGVESAKGDPFSLASRVSVPCLFYHCLRHLFRISTRVTLVLHLRVEQLMMSWNLRTGTHSCCNDKFR